MGDPICKWRNASIDTVVELVGELPKTQMTVELFRDFMNSSIYGPAFTRTAYQLACQLALYYITDDGYYIPRFSRNISEFEAMQYLQKWMSRYYVPNPYTKKGFDLMNTPVNLLCSFVEYLKNYPSKNNIVAAGNAIFGEDMGNVLCVKYILNEYSKTIEVDKQGDMNLIANYPMTSCAVCKNRDDKKEFFEHFN